MAVGRLKGEGRSGKLDPPAPPRSWSVVSKGRGEGRGGSSSRELEEAFRAPTARSKISAMTVFKGRLKLAQHNHLEDKLWKMGPDMAGGLGEEERGHPDRAQWL